MNADYQKIREDLAALGLSQGDSVLVHSSYKSMGGLEGGIQTFVEALLSVVGDTGTLIVPTLTFVEVSETNRVFDYLRSPSCVGAISEFVRQMDGAKRSINPTHSCAAIGYKRDWFVGSHQLDRTPVGPNSPIWKLHEEGGKVLMLGCRLFPNTSMHGVEELSRPWYLMKPERTTFRLLDENGNETVKAYECHNFKHAIQRYDRLAQVMDIPWGKVLNADCYLIDAKQMWKAGHEKLMEDPDFFIDRR